MTISLASITTAPEFAAPRIIVYGEHGVGKTTFALGNPRLGLAGAAAPILLRTENGIGTLSVPKFPVAQSFNDVIDALTTLYVEEHDYQTLVLDSLDWLEPLVWARTCARLRVDSIESVGYGKGYTYADEDWQQIIDGLDALCGKGMTIVCLAHAEIKRFDAPDTPSYDRYAIKLHKRAAARLQEWADVVGLARLQTIVQSTDVGFKKIVTKGGTNGERILSVQINPAYYAKNRYGMPEHVPLSWPAFMQALAPAYVTPPASESTAPNAAETDADEAALEDEHSEHGPDCNVRFGGACDCGLEATGMAGYGETLSSSST